MRPAKSCSLVTLAVILAVVAPLEGQAGRIEGRVATLRGGQPLAGARVSVVGTTLGTLTDTSGTYFLAPIPAGAWRVRATAIGFPAVEDSVLVVAGETAVLNLPLGLERDFAISLPSQRIVPSPMRPDSAVASLAGFAAAGQVHPIVQLRRHPTRRERADLRAAGLDLTTYVGGTAWYAHVDPAVAAGGGPLDLIRWAGLPPPSSRIHPMLRRVGPRTWADPPSGPKRLTAWFHPDVTDSAAQAVLASWGAGLEAAGGGRYHVTLDYTRVDSLAREDAVMELGPLRPALEDQNDRSRLWSRTAAVHAGTDGTLGTADDVLGTGVTVGMWEGGLADGSHPGISLTFSEPSASITDSHATRVAGIIAGDGSGDTVECAARGSTAPCMQGHAPGAALTTHSNKSPNTNCDACPTSVVVEVESAMQTLGVSVANNSFNEPVGWRWDNSAVPDCSGSTPGSWTFPEDNQDLFGSYTSWVAAYDALVRATNLTAVFIAANDRNDFQFGASAHSTLAGSNCVLEPTDTETRNDPDWGDRGFGLPDGYRTIPPYGTGRNVITVGGIVRPDQNGDGVGDTTIAASGWGPVGGGPNGWIKPDLVAPGTGIWTATRNGPPHYAPSPPGTSYAAPAVSGIVALLIEAYRREFFGTNTSAERPTPSTIRAVLMQSARDLGTAGPDYQYGWGAVDAKAAFDVIDNRLIVESEFWDQGEEQRFIAHVSGSPAELRVTIAWDDVPGAVLQNDLDFYLIDPAGTQHYPWLLDPEAPDQPACRSNAVARASGTDCSASWTEPRDDRNAIEQVAVVPPVNGDWEVVVRAAALGGLSMTNPNQRYSLASNVPLAPSTPVSVVQAIDRTGSMATYQYMGPAREAAINFVELMTPGDELGVVAFADDGCDQVGPKATSVFALATLTGTTKSAAQTAIDGITAGGCTSIGAGLELATGPTFLGGAAAANPKAIVLLTDGFENTPPTVADVLPSIPMTTRVFSIALGPTADATLMRDLAQDRSGTFLETPTVLGLLGVYYQIQADITGAEVIVSADGFAPPEFAFPDEDDGDMPNAHGEGDPLRSSVRLVEIDQGVSEVTFAVGWLQPRAELTLRVTDPTGADRTTGPAVSQGTTRSLHYVRIGAPEPGQWAVEIARSDTIPDDVPYHFGASVLGARKVWTWIPTEVTAGACVPVEAQIYGGRRAAPVARAAVWGTFSAPVASATTEYVRLLGLSDSTRGRDWTDWFSNASGLRRRARQAPIVRRATGTLRLLDNGRGADRIPGDGVYTACASTRSSGPLTIDLRLNGTVDGHTFTRRRLLSTMVRPARAHRDSTPVVIVPSSVTPSVATMIIVPTDRFGNVIGPGFADRIAVTSAQWATVDAVSDNGDGYYFVGLRGRVGGGAVQVRVGDFVKRAIMRL